MKTSTKRNVDESQRVSEISVKEKIFLSRRSSFGFLADARPSFVDRRFLGQSGSKLLVSVS